MNSLVDKVCDVINTRPRDSNGVDIMLFDIDIKTANKLCELFSVDGVLSLEAVFGRQSCFCWGASVEEHRTWVDAH